MTNDKPADSKKVIPIKQEKPANGSKPAPQPASPPDNNKLPKSSSEAVLNLPPVTQALCWSMLAAQIFLPALPGNAWNDIQMDFGFVPARYIGDIPFGTGGIFAPVGHMFLHAGWLHAGMNIATLMAFGSVIERLAGVRKMLLLFFLSGIAGAVLHFFVFPQSQLPLIGASGGISGLFGAVLIMMQPGGGKTYKVILPFVLIWVGSSLFFGFYGMPGVEGAVAWTSHIGGFVTGIFLAFRLKV